MHIKNALPHLVNYERLISDKKITSVNWEKTLEYLRIYSKKAHDLKIWQSITYAKEYFYILFSTPKHIAQA